MDENEDLFIVFEMAECQFVALIVVYVLDSAISTHVVGMVFGILDSNEIDHQWHWPIIGIEME